MSVSAFLLPLLDALFPPRCLHCGRAGVAVCATCLGTATEPVPPLCARCGQQLTAQRAGRDGLCPTCGAEPEPHDLEMSRAVALHDGVMREAILALKYKRRRRVAEPLGDLLALWLLENQWKVDVIVPVPLHPNRQRARGFNQAELIGRRCARRLGVAFQHDLLRTRETPPQVGLSAAERKVNVADAFAIGARAQREALAGKRAVLVDDVATTGSTLRAAAHALQVAQPLSIRALTVTRAHFDDTDADAAPLRVSGRRSGMRA